MPRKQSPVATRATKIAPTSLFERTGGDEDEVVNEEPKDPPIKRTFHLEPDLVLLLNELQLEEHRRTRKKPALSALVGEAIRHLAAERHVGVTAADGQ